MGIVRTRCIVATPHPQIPKAKQVMEACEQSVMHRLETALAELECEFHYLLNDVNIDMTHKLHRNPIALQSLRAASQYVSAARRLVRESPVDRALEVADDMG